MAEKLQFSLVSPVRELFTGQVDQVDAPGSEGDFGVLAGHAPFIPCSATARMIRKTARAISRAAAHAKSQRTTSISSPSCRSLQKTPPEAHTSTDSPSTAS